MPPIPKSGQKTIPLSEWKRFVQVADWWDRTFGHRAPSVLPPTRGFDLIVFTPEAGIPASDGTRIYSAACKICVPVDDPENPGEKTYEDTDNEILVYNLDHEAVAGESHVPTGLTHWGTRYVIKPELSGLRGACLSEDHPGRGTEFGIVLGTWDPDDQVWAYDGGTAAVAIDWRYGVPYPSAGATGLFQPKPSTANGTVWEVVALDCESPGDPCGGA